MQSREQFGTGLVDIAGPTETVVTFDRAEADQPLVGPGGGRIQPHRLTRRVVAGELARRFDPARTWRACAGAYNLHWPLA
jgi:hypothetical protein